ncbi:hypothetical protein [Spirochaeta dissipatitropha]
MKLSGYTKLLVCLFLLSGSIVAAFAPENNPAADSHAPVFSAGLGQSLIGAFGFVYTVFPGSPMPPVFPLYLEADVYLGRDSSISVETTQWFGWHRGVYYGFEASAGYRWRFLSAQRNGASGPSIVLYPGFAAGAYDHVGGVLYGGLGLWRWSTDPNHSLQGFQLHNPAAAVELAWTWSFWDGWYARISAGAGGMSLIRSSFSLGMEF